MTSAAFAEGGRIPIDFTCDGADQSPPLTWSAVPSGTRSIAVIVEDADAPGGTFTHWTLFDVRPDVTSLSQGTDANGFGGASGMNDFRRVGYSGPCPPKMELHHYAFRVFALDAPVGAPAGAAPSRVESAMNGHVLAEGDLIGTFSH